MFSQEETEFLLDWVANFQVEQKVGDASVEQIKTDHPGRHGVTWAADEHARFLEAVQIYPSGPWKNIAAYIGTRTARQTRTHAQKHKQKVERRQRKQDRLRLSRNSSTDGSASGSMGSAGGVHATSDRHGLPWTSDEHERFLSAIEEFPNGPWRVVADRVGTRTVRQVMTHGQKYRQKLARQRQRHFSKHASSHGPTSGEEAQEAQRNDPPRSERSDSDSESAQWSVSSESSGSDDNDFQEWSADESLNGMFAEFSDKIWPSVHEYARSEHLELKQDEADF